ncbi:MAG TPA: PAS domain-containing protein [Dongiaceae bacterium]|nr:PAS domain-containing protein [Dongiaceae bacterium]
MPPWGALEGIKLITTAELNSDIVRAVIDYWQSKQRDGKLPTREELEPADIPRLLPNIMLKEVRRDPWDFRYRVVGTAVREHSRSNWTGKWMSEIDGQGADSTVFRVVRWVSEEGRPAIYRPPYVGPHKEFKYCEAAVLPWSNAAGLIDRLMVAVDYLVT